MTKTRRAVTYSRVSGDDTQKENLNIDGQIRDCRDYAISKGYHVTEEIAEDPKVSTSGADSSLPGFQRIWQLAKTKSFDVLVCRQMDRLSRDQMKYLTLKTHLKQHGITIEFLNISGSYEDNFSGKIIESVMALIAENERDEIQKRTMRGKRNKVKSGSTMFSSRRPFGYQIVWQNGKQTLEIDETEAKVVRQTFAWYISGESLGSIARKLTDMRVPTVADTLPNKRKLKKHSFGHWEKSSVRVILKYHGYYGQWVYGRDSDNPLTVEIPAIISKETYDLAQKQIAINQKNSKRNGKYQYLMARRLTCPVCETVMPGKTYDAKRKNGTVKRYQYYNCFASVKNRRPFVCSNKTNYSVQVVDNAVWQFVVDLLQDPDTLEEKLFEQYEQQQTDINPLYEKIAITDDLIKQHTDRRDSLIETISMLPKKSEAKESIAEQIVQQEQTVGRLKLQKAEYQSKIDTQSSLTPETINTLVTAARMAQFRTKLQLIEDFEDKRSLIDMLNVRASLYTQNGKQFIEITCYVTEALVMELSSPCCTKLNEQHNTKHNQVIITHTMLLQPIAA